MLTLIQSTHAELKGIYGSPRMVRELRDRGFPACKKRVERLMRENDIRARHKRRYKVTTDSKHNLPIAPNLLDRNFNPVAPNQVWTSDITYLWTDEGWLYLAICSSRPKLVPAVQYSWFFRPAPRDTENINIFLSKNKCTDSPLCCKTHG